MQPISLPELKFRWHRCRTLLRKHLPGAGGIIVFSRINIYYLTGTSGKGLLWLPLEGEPVLLCRRGLERARLESPLPRILPYRSFSEIEGLCREAGSPLSTCFALEMNGLSWALGQSFSKYLGSHSMVGGDLVMSMTRAKKSAMELSLMREAGARHHRCLTELLPPLLSVEMTELDISHTLSSLFYQEGHQGILRMENYGEEVFLGHISAGDSGNYPSVFNGPLGLRGVHQAVPHMGSAGKRWSWGEPLTIDNGFSLEGYQTDKTQVYWLGEPDTIPAGVRTAHEFCIEMQCWLADNLKTGARPSRLWDHCRTWADRGGFSEGFMGLGANKVHFVGHGIGLAIDEYPVIAKGFDQPLETGMVLALEPKIGIPGVGMVGVENTFEVTPEGGRSITGTTFEMICLQ